MTQEIYNVLVIGKTGTGKSGFINYLFGKEVAQSDAGRPQTKEGFHKNTLKIQDLPPVNVFDSWGLEADKHEKWMELLNKELEKRGTSKPAQEWFHSVFYCIQASGHRVEPADVAIVNRLIEQKYPVTILLTKSDLVSEEDEIKMQETVNQEFQGKVKAIPICIGAETRNGKTKPFGRDKVIASMKSNCYLGLANRLPLHLRDILDENLMLWKKEALRIINSVGYTDDKEKLTELKNLSDKKSKDIPGKLKEEAFSIMKIYEKILIWTGKDVSFNKLFTKQEIDLNWAEKVFIFFPPIFLGLLVFGLATAKSDNREKLQKTFEEYYSEVKSHCEKFIAAFESYLQKEAAKVDA
jgi:GTP-binding protein EngB required for normal cell division